MANVRTRLNATCRTKEVDNRCNDLFSRFEQQILFLEKQAEATKPTMDRHGHDGPSRGLVSKTLINSEIWVLKSTL